MDTFVSLLRLRAKEIAAAAAEHTASERLGELLARLIQDVADSLASGAAIDLTPLRRKGADDAALARLLRLTLAEAIQMCRSAPDQTSFPQFVVALRNRLAQVIPRPSLDPGRAAPYQELLAADSGNLEDRQTPLLSLCHAAMNVSGDMVFAHDMAGNVLYMNEKGLAMTRFTREDLVRGMSIYDFVVPEYLDLFEARLESPGAVQRSPYTLEICTKDGERVAVEVATAPVMWKGEATGVIVAARDLGLARRLEEDLKWPQACLDNLLANSPFGVLIADTNLVVQHANPAAAKMSGATAPRDLVGLRLDELTKEVDEDLRHDLAGALAGEQHIRRRQSAFTRFGKTLDCEATILPILTQWGPPAGVIVLMEAGGRPAAEKPASQPDRLSDIGKIAAGVAHDLNNPMTAILGYAQFILGLELNEELRSRVASIAIEAERCRKIIQDLLIFARARELDKSRQEINHLIAETVSLLEYQLRADDVELVTKLDPGSPTVLVDPQELRRVFLNLITNALQSLENVHDRQRRLAVSTCQQEGEVWVRVEDNGQGIPDSIQPKVFDPFFTTREIGAGTGLGLSVAYGIIRDHGGRVVLESEEGKGAAFTVILPLG